MKLRDWSLRRWALIAAAIIVLPLIGMRLHLKWQLKRAVAELQAAGHPTTYEELYLRQGVIEGATNMVAALTNAILQAPEPSVETCGLLPVFGTLKTPPPGERWPDEVETVTREFLTTQREVMHGIHAALAITNAWWWTTYNPAHWAPNGISKAKGAASRLSLEAAFLAQSGDLDGAMRSTGSTFIIAERMYADPILISHLVRVAIQSIALTRLEYVLSSGGPSATALRQMREVLRPQLAQVSVSHVYEGERVFFLEPAYHRSSGMSFGDALVVVEPGSWEGSKQTALALAYRMSGLADRDILYALESFQDVSSRADTLAGQVQLEQSWSQLLPSNQGRRFHYWSEQAFSIVPGKFLKRPIDMQGKIRAADATLAVAQYRIRHDGKLPASLAELVPEFLEAVPVEPQSDKPFELIVTTDGYGIGRGTPGFKVKLNRDR